MKVVDKSKIGGSYNDIRNSLFTGFKTLRDKIGFGIVLLVLLLCIMPISLHIKAEPDENDTNEIYYRGKVTGRVNVRTGPGTDHEQLKVNGKGVTLQPGATVIILGEAMVGTKPWYHIRFEVDGETVEGHSTSSYIDKLNETITPTPLPTNTPAPTLTPTPTIEPTPTEVVADITDTPNQEEGKKDLSKGVVTALIVIFVLAAIAILVFIILKSFHSKEKKEMTKAVKGLKNVRLGEKQAEKPGNKSKSKQPDNRKTPVIKSTRRDAIESEGLTEDSYNPEIYVKENDNSIFDNLLPENNTEERIKEAATKETDEKKILRKEIDSLRQHDVVEHKYFGKGEVYDNSDVKLIEVRFGNDVRFLNKDSLVAKKLLKKSRDVNARWHV